MVLLNGLYTYKWVSWQAETEKPQGKIILTIKYMFIFKQDYTIGEK